MTRDFRSGAALVVVLCGAVVAIAAAGRSWAVEGSGSGVSDRLVGLVLVGALAVGWLALGGRLARGLFDRLPTAPGARLVAGVAAALAVGLILLLVVVAHRAEWFSDNSCCGPTTDFSGKVGRGVAVSGGAGGGGHTAGSGMSALVLWGLIGLSVVVGICALVLVVRERRRAAAGQASEESALAAAMTEALSRSLDDLRAMSDLRRAVIACYARMERALAVAGVRRDPVEAPFEYLERVLLRLRASADAARQLTALFEEAKFSLHPVGEPMRERAIAALVQLREELQAA